MERSPDAVNDSDSQRSGRNYKEEGLRLLENSARKAKELEVERRLPILDENLTVESVEAEMDVLHKLQSAMENLERLKPQIELMKSNHQFVIQFQAYIDLLK